MIYVPKPYPGKLLLIRPKCDYRKYVGQQDLQATAGVRVVRIPCFPAGLMTPPYVDQVARLVESSVDDGLRESGIDPNTMDRFPASTRADESGEKVDENTQIANLRSGV